jgi:hypothetical protein
MLEITRYIPELDTTLVTVVPMPSGDVTEYLLHRYGIDALTYIVTRTI